MIEQGLNGLRAKTGNLLAMQRCEVLKEMLHQQRYVITTFSQRRQMNRKNVESEKQILAKGALSDSGTQVDVSGRHHPQINLDWLAASNPFDLPLL